MLARLICWFSSGIVLVISVFNGAFRRFITSSVP